MKRNKYFEVFLKYGFSSLQQGSNNCSNMVCIIKNTVISTCCSRLAKFFSP